MTSEAPEPPPEAKLIRLARQAKGMSPEDAAPLTGGMIKASRWRQIENGYATRSGERIATIATSPVLARMAFIVGVTPGQLSEAGREDASPILEQILVQETGPRPRGDDVPSDHHLRRLVELWPQLLSWQRQSLVGIAREMISDTEDAKRTERPSQDQRRTG